MLKCKFFLGSQVRICLTVALITSIISITIASLFGLWIWACLNADKNIIADVIFYGSFLVLIITLCSIFIILVVGFIASLVSVSINRYVNLLEKSEKKSEKKSEIFDGIDQL